MQRETRINDQSIEYLVKALDSKDKQTCIHSAKSLYLAGNTHKIKYPLLFELQKHIENKIYDVFVYSTVAYVRSLEKLSSSYGSIMASYVSFFAQNLCI